MSSDILKKKKKTWKHKIHEIRSFDNLPHV